MSRPQPSTARLWLPRVMLVLLTLTGLGIWQDGHCIEGASAHHATSVAVHSAGSATTATSGFGTAAAPAVSAHHHDVHASGPLSTTADTCYIAPALVARTTMTAILVLQTVERAAPVAPSSRPSMPHCFAPGVALTRLGISRT